MGDYCIKCERRREEVNRDKKNKPLNITDIKHYYGFVCYICIVGEDLNGKEINNYVLEGDKK